MRGCLSILGWLALLALLLVIDHSQPDLSGWLLICGLIGVAIGIWRGAHKEPTHA